MAGDEIGRKLRQPVMTTLRPVKFDRYILPFRIAVFPQSLAERSYKRRERAGRAKLRKPITGIAFCCARTATPAFTITEEPDPDRRRSRDQPASAGPAGLA